MESTLHYTSVSHADSMMDSINKMRRSSDFCDVTVVVGNFRIMAHRIILSASAPFFYELLKPCQIATPAPEFHLDDLDETAALKIIEFCYTSALSLDEDTVWPLMIAATKLDFSEITSLCCEFLTSSLDLPNCINVHLLALKHGAAKLLTHTKQFISENIEQLREHQSLHSLDADGIIQLITSLQDLLCSDSELLLLAKPWLEHNTQHRRQVSLKLSQDIPTFSKKLQEYLTHRMSSTDQDKLPVDENGITRGPQTDTDRQLAASNQQDSNDPNGVPLHICVSCGDEFDSQSQLTDHQTVCNEAAHQTVCNEAAHQVVCDVSTDQKISGQSPQAAATLTTRTDLIGREQDIVDDPSPLAPKAERLPLWPVLKDLPDLKGRNPRKILRRRERKMKSPIQSTVSLVGIGNLKDNSDRCELSLNRDQNSAVINNDQLVEGKADVSLSEAHAWPNVHSSAGELSSEEDQSSSGDEIYLEDSVTLEITDSPQQGSHLNDTNNNDICDTSAVQNDDGTGDEIDVVNDGIDEGPVIGVVTGDKSPRSMSTQNQFSLSVSPKSLLSNYILNDQNKNGRSLLGNLKCQICNQHFDERKHLAKHWKHIHGVEHDKGGHHIFKKPDSDAVRFEPIDTVVTRQKGSNKATNLQDSIVVETSGGGQTEDKPEAWLLNGGVKDSAEEFSPEMIKQLLRQYNYYNELSKWCLEQGAAYCHMCMVYHNKGNMCPKTSLDQKPDQVISNNLELKPLKCNSNNETEKDPGISYESLCEEDRPLDMSKSSVKYSAGCKSAAKFSVNHSSTNTPFVPLSQDLSQYYNSYAHIMASAAAGNIQDRGQYALLCPDAQSQPRTLDFPSELMYPPYLSYPASSPYPLNLASDHPRPAQAADHNDRMGVSSEHQSHPSKRKVSTKQGFPCTVCSRVFSYQAALFTHMRTHSPSARLYQCTLCHQNFARAPDLKVHVCPNGVEKPYTCSSCGQTFAKNIHLKRHLATHSGLKPYPCWVCGKRFSRSDHLKRHTQSIHAGTRPHGCQVCGKEFVRKYELNKHMMSHTVEHATGEQSGSTPGALDFGQSLDTVSGSQHSQRSSPSNGSMS